MRIFSFGGGVQSTSVMVLQAQGKLLETYDYFIFADVGKDSEHPKTIEYIEKVSKPYCKRHGLEFVEVQKTRFDVPETLYMRQMRDDRSIGLPVRYTPSGAPARRACTTDFKIYPIGKWVKQQGINRVEVGLGISLDEIHRARSTEWEYDKRRRIHEKKEYPLIDLGLKRIDCMNLIKGAGLPVPPRSSCYFCPYHRQAEWVRMKKDEPELFYKTVEMEKFLQKKRHKIGREGEIYFHSSLKPLDVAVGLQENFFDELDNCESGYCMT